MGVTSWSDSRGTAYVSIPDATQLISGDSVLAIPDLQMKVNFTYGSGYTYKYKLNRVDVYRDSTKIAEIRSNESATAVANNVYCAATGWASKPTLTVSDLFTSANSTVRTIPFRLKTSSNGYTYLEAKYTQQGGGGDSFYEEAGDITLAVINVTLDAQPTFTTSDISYDTDYVYADLTTASVTISNASAMYDGTIISSELAIGNQVATGSGNGTLSIVLDTVGTFTPTVTVTDSRGQTATKTLPRITVNGYVAPTANISVERANTSGVADDEGKCAVITADLYWASAIADLTAPTVVVKDLDNNTQTSVTTWYTSKDSSGVSNAISDWSQVTPAVMPIYGLVDNAGHDLFNTQYSYTVLITPNDDIQSGITVTRTLGSAFYTIDFLEGGHVIAFGQPSSQPGFYVNMDTNLLKGVEVIGDADISGDVTVDGIIESLDGHIDIPDYSSSGTDKEIYDALVSLGWQNDVAPNNTPMSVKKFLAKLINIANSPRIVEQGTSGNWKYRKWSDGTAECWSTQTITTAKATSTWGSAYYGILTNTLTFPEDLFTAKPEILLSLQSPNGRFWVTHGNDATALNVGTIFNLAPQEYRTASTVTLGIYAIDMWDMSSWDGGTIPVVAVTDYNTLVNKPQIEDVTLSGNKTFPNLNLDALSNSEIQDIFDNLV